MNANRSGLACMGAGLLALLATAPTSAQTPPPTTPFENPQFRYAVALPNGCRHDEGPGTIEAVCSADLDAEKSASASAASSLLLEVGAEAVADDVGKSAVELAQRYGETAFRDELPEAVCGETDKARVKIGNARQVSEDTRVVYTADVSCPEIKFLQLGERQALVRFVIAPGVRYRVMARAMSEDFEKHKPTIEAFLTSFRVLPEKKSP
jgi:hypothetical protein